jgi:hypothetical protein
MTSLLEKKLILVDLLEFRKVKIEGGKTRSMIGLLLLFYLINLDVIIYEINDNDPIALGALLHVF